MWLSLFVKLVTGTKHIVNQGLTLARKTIVVASSQTTKDTCPKMQSPMGCRVEISFTKRETVNGRVIWQYRLHLVNQTNTTMTILLPQWQWIRFSWDTDYCIIRTFREQYPTAVVADLNFCPSTWGRSRDEWTIFDGYKALPKHPLDLVTIAADEKLQIANYQCDVNPEAVCHYLKLHNLTFTLHELPRIIPSAQELSASTRFVITTTILPIDNISHVLL
jgi:hypothetical protein